MVKKIMCIGVLLVMIFSLFGCGKEFVPEPLSPEALSVETENQIKQDYFDWLGDSKISSYKLTVEDMRSCYCGTYNDYIAVILGFVTEEPIPNPGANPSPTFIAGVEFIFGWNTSYFVWKDGQFTSWSDAYEQGLLSKKDIRSIHYYYMGK